MLSELQTRDRPGIGSEWLGWCFAIVLSTLLRRPTREVIVGTVSSIYASLHERYGRKPPHLLDIVPLEILTRIMQEMEWRELLSFRKTCRTLNNLSRSHSIWLNLAQKYNAALPGSSQPGNLTTGELESWVMTRMSADLGWQSEGTSPPSRRIIQCSGVQRMHLVPGGRWLFVRLWKGSVLLFDLDTPEPQGQLIIQPIDPVDMEVSTIMVVEMDNSTPNLACYIGVLQCHCHDESSPPRLSVWRVILSPATGGVPTSQLVNSFETPGRGMVTNVSLRGKYFARSVRTFPPVRQYIEVYDWVESTSTTHKKSTFLLADEDGPKAVRLLPNNRLLVFTHSIDIYDVPNPRATPPVALTSPSVPRLVWNMPSIRGRIGSSQIFETKNDIRATVFIDDGIYGLEIQTQSHLSPTFSLLYRYPKLDTWPKVYVGLYKAAIQITQTRFDTITYTWDDDSNKDSQIKTWDFSGPTEMDISDSININPVLDEETGRVVQPAYMGLAVLDFALSRRA